MSQRPIALLAAVLLAGLLARDAWPPDETRNAEVERIGRGYLKGRPLVALRAVHAAATPPDRIR